jgi:hypothetical protein
MLKLRYQQLSADAMLLFKLVNGILVAAGIFHVDDLILTCRPHYDYRELKIAFEEEYWPKNNTDD